MLKIILDTNIWVSTAGLKSRQGSEFRYWVRTNKNVQIVLPDVVRLESSRLLLESVKGNIKDIEKAYRQILALAGSYQPYKIPTVDEARAWIDGLYSGLGVPIVGGAPAALIAKAAHARVLECKLPITPKRSNNYKDAVIWEQCLHDCASSAVVLVTSDSIFFEDSSLERDLAPNLKEEVEALDGELQIFSNLKRFLDHVEFDPPFREQDLVEAFLSDRKEEIDYACLDEDVFLDDLESCDFSIRLTENPERVEAIYSMLFKCRPSVSDRDVLPDRLECTGIAVFSIDNHTFEFHEDSRAFQQDFGLGTNERATLSSKMFLRTSDGSGLATHKVRANLRLDK